MSKQREHRAAKKREKTRLKRKKIQTSRGSRNVMGASADAVRQSGGWPMWEAWASEDWYERGAHAHVCFSRKHDDGRIAAAFFELDLAERGVVDATARTDATVQAVRIELGRRSEDGKAMVEVEPDLVVKLVDSARAWGEKQGHTVPSGFQRARGVFGSASGRHCDHDIRCGSHDPEEAPAASQKAGWFSKLKRAVGLS